MTTRRAKMMERKKTQREVRSIQLPLSPMDMCQLVTVCWEATQTFLQSHRSKRMAFRGREGGKSLNTWAFGWEFLKGCTLVRMPREKDQDPQNFYQLKFRLDKGDLPWSSCLPKDKANPLWRNLTSTRTSNYLKRFLQRVLKSKVFMSRLPGEKTRGNCNTMTGNTEVIF